MNVGEVVQGLGDGEIHESAGSLKAVKVWSKEKSHRTENATH